MIAFNLLKIKFSSNLIEFAVLSKILIYLDRATSPQFPIIRYPSYRNQHIKNQSRHNSVQHEEIVVHERKNIMALIMLILPKQDKHDRENQMQML